MKRFNLPLNRYDIVILVVSAAAAFVLMAAFYFNGKAAGAGAYVRVTAGGALVARLPLNEDAEAFEITTDDGLNIIRINTGRVYMDYADCLDKLCLRQGSIYRSGQTIVCLPNGVIVEIQGAKDGLDAISK